MYWIAVLGGLGFMGVLPAPMIRAIGISDWMECNLEVLSNPAASDRLSKAWHPQALEYQLRYALSNLQAQDVSYCEHMQYIEQQNKSGTTMIALYTIRCWLWKART
jgi:hypothetical protein